MGRERGKHIKEGEVAVCVHVILGGILGYNISRYSPSKDSWPTSTMYEQVFCRTEEQNN